MPQTASVSPTLTQPVVPCWSFFSWSCPRLSCTSSSEDTQDEAQLLARGFFPPLQHQYYLGRGKFPLG